MAAAPSLCAKTSCRRDYYDIYNIPIHLVLSPLWLLQISRHRTCTAVVSKISNNNDEIDVRSRRLIIFGAWTFGIIYIVYRITILRIVIIKILQVITCSVSHWWRNAQLPKTTCIYLCIGMCSVLWILGSYN